MKILILWTYQSTYIEAAAKSLVDTGNSVTIVYAQNLETYPKLKDVNPNLIRFPFLNKDVLAQLHEENWDCIYIAGWHIKVYRKYLKKIKNTKRILYMDNQYIGSLKQKMFVKFAKFFLSQYFDAVFVPGIRQKKYALKLGFRETNISIFGISVDNAFFLSKVPLKLSCSAPFIYVGRLAPEKNISLLLEAYEKYRSRVDLPRDLNIVGPNDGFHPELNIGVNYLGYKTGNEIRSLFNSSHAFVMPSKFEPFGVAMIEAAASGLPIISSNAVGAADHVVSNANGVLFNATDAGQLADALCHLHNCTADWYQNASQFSREYAKQFSESSWKNNFLNLAASVKSPAGTYSSKDSVMFYLAVIPSYRSEAINLLGQHFGDSIQFFASTSSIDKQVFTDFSNPKISAIRMIRMGSLFMQFGHFREALGVKTLVLDLNPRSISAWLLLISRKFLSQRRTLLWGHLSSRGKDFKQSNPSRKFMRTLSDATIVYTYTDHANSLIQIPTQNSFVAPNSLYNSENLEGRKSDIRNSILYSGRLIIEKKVDLLIRAFASSGLASMDVKLLIIGDGPMREELIKLSADLKVSESVQFIGKTFDFENLSKHYSKAFVSVCPGYVGLNLTQSLGFGVPMIIARDERHSPEIELYSLQESLYFDLDDADSLSEKLKEVYEKPDAQNDKMNKAVSYIRSNYSSNQMYLGLKCAILNQEQKPLESKGTQNEQKI